MVDVNAPHAAAAIAVNERSNEGVTEVEQMSVTREYYKYFDSLDRALQDLEKRLVAVENRLTAAGL